MVSAIAHRVLIHDSQAGQRSRRNSSRAPAREATRADVDHSRGLGRGGAGRRVPLLGCCLPAARGHLHPAGITRCTEPTPGAAVASRAYEERHVTDQLDMAYAQPGRYWLRDELGRVVVRWSETEP